MKTLQICNSGLPSLISRRSPQQVLPCRSQLVLAVLLLLGVCVSARSALASGLAATPSTVAFGSVALGVKNSQTVKLSNPGATGLTLSTATVSGPGFTISGLTVPVFLSPSHNLSFTVYFDPASPGTVYGSIAIKSTFSTLTISLSGSGSSATRTLSASASSISFGNVNVGQSSSQTVNLTASGNSAVTVSAVSSSGTGISTSGVSRSTTLNPGQAAALTVQFAPTAAGTVNGSVTVTSNAANSPIKISVTATGVTSSNSYSVNLGWSASSSSGVTGYNVYRGTVSGGPYSKIVSSPVSGINYTDSTVKAGVDYYYVVTSVSSSGESGYSSQVAADVP